VCLDGVKSWTKHLGTQEKAINAVTDWATSSGLTAAAKFVIPWAWTHSSHSWRTGEAFDEREKFLCHRRRADVLLAGGT
jgi:hypothetical protein